MEGEGQHRSTDLSDKDDPRVTDKGGEQRLEAKGFDEALAITRTFRPGEGKVENLQG